MHLLHQNPLVVYQETQTKAVNGVLSQAVQANPEKAATPQGFAELASGVYNQFRSMHPAMQAMVGLGLPIGLIGILNGLFGKNGGLGSSILGVLGLGAAGLGAASGGLFGEQAQNAVNNTAGDLFNKGLANMPRSMQQGLYDTASFFGAAPGPQDLSVLMADDPVAAAASGTGESDSFLPNSGDVQAQYDAAMQKKQQLDQLLALPEAQRNIALMGMDKKNIKTPEDAARAFSAAQKLRAAFDDPNSAIGVKLQQAQDYLNPGEASWGSSAGWGGRLNNAYSGLTNLFKQSAVEKWAFNDVDAKELHDLEKEKAKGAPRRMDDARRLNQLQMRRTAQKPACGQKKPAVKRIITITCMKCARCWAGYEPVPGKAPYTEDSCRPKKAPAKKKKKETVSQKS